MSDNSTKHPRVGVEQIWTDFDNLPDNLFGSWSQLMKSEFIDNIRQKLTKAEGVKNEQ